MKKNKFIFSWVVVLNVSDHTQTRAEHSDTLGSKCSLLMLSAASALNGL